jgi:flagellar M-ring protein FliF
MDVQNLVTIWQGLGLRRQLVVLGATVAMFLAVLAIARTASAPQMALLYAGLDRAAAGEVVSALEQEGVAYQIDGDAISVDAARRDSLRMTLAAQGLPANAGTGYELLDSLSGFGTTSQMFDAAYWRAKEGELARTILANPDIRAARVHIAQGPVQPFAPDGRPSASVTVTSGTGTGPEMAKAIRHLVAAAVLNLRPEDVAVIDTQLGLIPNTDDGLASAPAASGRAEEIRRNVERLLGAHVGLGKAVVEVAVELVSERETLTERRLDPAQRVAISTETEESGGSSQGNAGGAVTVASNLPEGAGAAGGGQQSQENESRERVNYEVGETRRELLRLPGDIRRLSVAVIIDEAQVVAEDGTVTSTPRSDDELAALRELVASAVGLDESRGDVLTLKSLPFQIPGEAGTLAEAGILSAFGPIDAMGMIQLAVLALVTLVLGLFVLRPILLSRQAALEGSALPAPEVPLALPGLGGMDARGGSLDMPGFPVFNGVIEEALGSPADSKEDPMHRLRRLIEERQAESLEILRGWMEESEEPA